MSFAGVLDIVVPIIFGVVGLALIWFVIELVITIRKVRGTVDDLEKQVKPMLDDVNDIVADVQPVVKKVDPVVDRVSLTVDAANLEIMRVDQILENVTDITGSVSKAVDTVGTVTSAPVDLVSSLTERVRGAFKPKYASDVSVELGESKDEGDEGKNTVKDFVNVTLDAAESAVNAQKEKMREHKEQREAKNEAEKEKNKELTDTADLMTSTIIESIGADANQSQKAVLSGDDIEAASGQVSAALQGAKTATDTFGDDLKTAGTQISSAVQDLKAKTDTMDTLKKDTKSDVRADSKKMTSPVANLPQIDVVGESAHHAKESMAVHHAEEKIAKDEKRITDDEQRLQKVEAEEQAKERNHEKRVGEKAEKEHEREEAKAEKEAEHAEKKREQEQAKVSHEAQKAEMKHSKVATSTKDYAEPQIGAASGGADTKTGRHAAHQK